MKSRAKGIATYHYEKHRSNKVKYGGLDVVSMPKLMDVMRGDNREDYLHRSIVEAIGSATKKVTVVTPYF